MEAETISTQIMTYITSEILRQPGRNLDSDAPLISNGLIDSFHLVDLALFVEERFGVIIDDTELTKDNFDSIAGLTTWIQARMI